VPPRQVRAETNLARAPGLWATGPVQLQLPFEAQGVGQLVRASGRLRLTPDLDVLAWVAERWLSTPPLDPEGWSRFTLHDLASDLYRSDPGRTERRHVRRSIERLMSCLVTVEGFDSETGRQGVAVATTSAPILVLISDLERVGPDARKVGSLRGSTFRVQLAPWLRAQLAAGGYTYLDWRVLRELDGLAKRAWVYLQAERFKPTGEGRSATAIGLGAPALASLGADGYARHRDARTYLARAGERIAAVDDRFESVTVERRPGGWALVAVKLDAAERRRLERERERVRAAIAASPLGEGLDFIRRT